VSSFFNQNQIEKIVSYAFAAGEIAEKFQKSGDYQTAKKLDNSSVTTADIAVSEFINQKLKKDFPEIPIICEEGKLRQAGDIFWLIDPIDGTNSFIDGSSEFAVNIALIKDKKAIFGLIYAPSFEGGKMIFSNHLNQIILQRKSQESEILQFKKNHSDVLRIITSARTKDIDVNNYTAQFYKDSDKKIHIEKLSSAAKFFRILENDADLYLHFRPSMEWDTAAGQALVELMNGQVKTLSFNHEKISIDENLLYQKPDFTNQSFIAFIN
jgi:3'(2'), 5'-bisphosphate nucleotidase